MKRCCRLSLSAKGNPENIRVIVKRPGERIKRFHMSRVLGGANNLCPDAVTQAYITYIQTHTQLQRERERERGSHVQWKAKDS